MRSPKWKIVAVAASLAAGQAPARVADAPAEPQAVAPLRFEVASVKLAANQDVLETRPRRSVGRFRWTTDLHYLLQYAYHMEWFRISVDTGTLNPIYDIEATADPKATDDQVRQMLQSLLEDRFKMVTHRGTKEISGYVLAVAKSGPKMQEAKEGELPALPEWMRGSTDDPAKLEELVVATRPSTGVGAITGRRVSMLDFAERLQRLVGATVLDQTGLSGKYYFALQYATGDDLDVPFPDLFSAVKQLGLTLEKHKGPVEILVVDHIETTPTEN